MKFENHFELDRNVWKSKIWEQITPGTKSTLIGMLLVSDTNGLILLDTDNLAKQIKRKKFEVIKDIEILLDKKEIIEIEGGWEVLNKKDNKYPLVISDES